MFLENSYNKIWELWRKLLFLSHDQGSTDRGFLVNQQIEVENVKEGHLLQESTPSIIWKELGALIYKVIINKGFVGGSNGGTAKIHGVFGWWAAKEGEDQEGERKKLIKAEIEELKERNKR